MKRLIFYFFFYINFFNVSKKKLRNKKEQISNDKEKNCNIYYRYLYYVTVIK